MIGIKKTICACLLGIMSLSAWAKDYQAVAFGVKSDGVTMNTRSIQQAIDYIAEQGGGRLIFYVGRYLTGSIELKSNVTIVIHEGAVLLASPSVYDLKGSPRTALIYADNQQNIAITGKGIIDGNSTAVMASINDQAEKGYLTDAVKTKAPALISLTNCTNVKVNTLMLQNAAYTPQVYTDCKDVKVDSIIFVPSAAAKEPIQAENCSNMEVTNSLTYPY